MTDNPTPNEIALLREALIAMGRMIPGVILDDRVSNTFLANLPEEMAHYSLHRSPGQHDGAAGEGQASDAAKAAFNDAFDAYAQHMGDPDGRDDYEAANNAAGLVLDAFAKPSTEQARAEGYVLVPREPTREMKDAALAAVSDITVSNPKATAWDCIRAYRAMVAAATPSGADALGGRL